MAVSQATIDSIRASACSIATCTPEIVKTLNDLLLPSVNPTKSSSSKKEPIKATAATRRKAPAAPKTQTSEQDNGGQLSPKERAILATEVVNGTLKALTEASKLGQSVQRKISSKDAVKASSRKTLRRSNSAPMSPIQPRSLERVLSSPNISNRSRRSSSTTAPLGHRSVAECTRVAFACLRALQASKVAGIDLPPLQLENGMSVFIGKIIGQGIDDLALKELRILKRRLDLDESLPAKKVAATSNKNPSTIVVAPGIGELIDFKEVPTGPKRALAISTQLQILRVMTTSRESKQIEIALTALFPSHASSPTSLLLAAAKDPKERNKAARQLQTLSELLLSLTPSVSAADDSSSTESKHCITPSTALQLQKFALQNRLLWWKLAGHKGEAEKDIFTPLLRCLSAYGRRSQQDALETYRIAESAMLSIQGALDNYADLEKNSNASITGIYRVLGSLAQEAALMDKASEWTQKMHSLLDPKTDSEVKRHAAAARLISVQLRLSKDSPMLEDLLLGLLEGIEKPFKGESTEIESLLTEVSAARRAVISVLSKESTQSNTAKGVREMCESLICSCPRLYIRFIGSEPESQSAKEFLRYEQRRRFASKVAVQAVDSALFLIKLHLGQGRLDWNMMDSLLQDCLSLLKKLDDLLGLSAMTTGKPSSYYMRVSNLYYTQYLNMRRDSNDLKDAQQVRALRRSIDCLQSRPRHERHAALLVTKLERLAEVCKAAGLYDELYRTLATIRDEMIENGALSAVAAALTSQPPRSSWSTNEETAVLGRTIASLIKVQVKYLSSLSQDLFLESHGSEEERAALFEQYLEVLSVQKSSSNISTELRNKVVEALLAIYSDTEYPLRRLRVLARAFSRSAQDEKLNIDGKLYEPGAADFQILNVKGSKDEKLQGYSTHLQAFAWTLSELQRDRPDVEVLKEGIAAWSAIVETCADSEALENRVENVPDFLAHLQTMADFMEIAGSKTTRLAILRLVTDIDGLYRESSSPDRLVLSFADLGLQWLHLGYTGKAGLALDKAQSYSQRDGVAPEAALQLHLSYSEYMLAIGNSDKCEEHLASAKAIYSEERENAPSENALSLQAKTRHIQTVANACLLHSMLALQRGASQEALAHARQSVRFIRGAWANVEKSIRQNDGSTETSSLEKLVDEVSNLSLSTLKPTNAPGQALCGSAFWTLLPFLFRSLTYLSDVYAFHGMFQETMYYAEQAHKLVKEAPSDIYLAIASTTLGNILQKAGTLDKSSELFAEAKALLVGCEKGPDTAILATHRGALHGTLGDQESEIASYEEAEAILKSLSTADYIASLERVSTASDSLADKVAELSISKAKPTRAQKTPARKTPARAKSTTQRQPARGKAPVDRTKSDIVIECPTLESLRSMAIRKKSGALAIMKRQIEAHDALKEAKTFASVPMDFVYQGIEMARQLLTQSVELMNADPVYSVLQDSTISYPSILGHAQKSGDRLSAVRTSPHAKKNAHESARSESPAPKDFMDALRQAQDCLTEVHATAVLVAPVSVFSTISNLLNSVAILLSTASPLCGKPLAHPGFTSCHIELARTLTFRRERKAMLAVSQSDSTTGLSWPSHGQSGSPALTGLKYDISRFQREYIDIIPKSWTALSISLSESHQELSITKLQAGHSPFVLRLPLGRNTSIDADEEVFGFEQGLAELQEIIELANESAHDARDMSGREAKVAWWETRESLDSRLKELLENIEKVWLGGFTGIFSQHARMPDLLARFQKSFQNILDKHLPSRQKTKKRNGMPRITLDTRILELFIGLGDASDEAADFSEPLTDLLYFVVDVLQFHGELNAYAEIDFDSIVIETHDALRSYHEAARVAAREGESMHTILILDKALHAFPWESMPCMQGLAVSRLPSIGCLRDRILMAQEGQEGDSEPEGITIDRTKGAYILNPGGDLMSTQTTFAGPLERLPSWTGITGRAPQESEFRSALATKDLLLYFGHGSGAQYVRSKDIRRLEACAVTFLMGCSSGALTAAGPVFEPYGTPMHYMHAGSPALVATLWDVTDKDIDRFATAAFEDWGLFDLKGKSKARGRGGRVRGGEGARAGAGEGRDDKISLVAAVAKAKDACHLRYLNAAAVVVYGVPVFLR